METHHHHRHETFGKIHNVHHHSGSFGQPHVHVHGHHQTYHGSHNYGYNGYYNHHHHRGASWGTVGLVGALIFIPIVIIALILKLTMGGVVGVTTASMTAAAAGAGSALAFSSATFGLGALAIYGAVGLAYLCLSAKEGYSGNKNVFEIMKSSVVNEDGLRFKGVMKSIGAVLWSPFILIGGLAGMGLKAAVSAFNNPKSAPKNEEDKSAEEGCGCPHMRKLAKKVTSSQLETDDVEPMHLDSIFCDPKQLKSNPDHNFGTTYQSSLTC